MTKTLNILFIPSWYPSKEDVQNGIFIKKHAEAASIKHKITVVYIKTSNKNDTFINIQGNLTEEIIYLKKSNLKIIQFTRVMRILLTRIKKIDIIHAHVWSKKTIFSFILSLLTGKPMIISEHWSGYSNEINILEKKLMKIIFKKAKYILPVSNFLKSLMKQQGIDGNFKIIGNVIEKKALKNIQSSTFNFLMVTDLRDDIKNISSVIKVFSSLQDENIRLTIIGDGPDKEKLTTMSNDHINFLGRLKNKEVLEELGHHHCVIINSRIETFSIVALESLASGRPVIYTRCGGVEENLSKESGISIEINNNDELKKAMLSIQQKYNSFKPKYLQSLTDHFSKSNIASKLDDIYLDTY